jgi:protein-arginine kinase activator protein McsA
MGSKKKEGKAKPLDEQTASELRETAKEIPEITGVHAMNKSELQSAIKKAKGIEEKKPKSHSSVRELKKKIKELKARRENKIEAGDERMAGILRGRILKLKKKTRRI